MGRAAYAVEQADCVERGDRLRRRERVADAQTCQPVFLGKRAQPDHSRIDRGARKALGGSEKIRVRLVVNEERAIGERVKERGELGPGVARAAWIVRVRQKNKRAARALRRAGEAGEIQPAAREIWNALEPCAVTGRVHLERGKRAETGDRRTARRHVGAHDPT